jgi:UDP-GlcNAc:undecaprenyl-phosphate GlcNAc-1-phosphate transferase
LLISFLTTLIATPIVKKIALCNNIFDSPDDILKIHTQPIPYLGGIAIYAGINAASLFGFSKCDMNAALFVTIFTAVSLIMCLGLVDDIYDIKQGWKFMVQIAIGVSFISFGTRINTFPLIYISVPVSVLYIIGVCNSLNLLDGLDGLAAGNTAISALFFSILFFIKGDQTGLVLSFALLGACVAFLIYNFMPAKIFMGDAGSMLLGFMLAILMLRYSSTPFDYKEFICPILICGVPIFDTGLTYLRRYINRRPIFPGDRSHFYDQLVNKGFSIKATVLISYALSVLLGIFALIINFASFFIFIILFFCLCLCAFRYVTKMKMLRM